MQAKILGLIAAVLIAGPVVGNAATTYYTFSGTVTTLDELPVSWDNGVNPNDYVSVGDAVTYVFAIDFDRPGEHTNWNGQTFTIPDLSVYDYFWVDLLEDVSSVTLPVPTLETTNPSSDALLNYGEYANTPVPIGRIFANSGYNQFMIYSIDHPDVSAWQVGTTLAGQSRALILVDSNSFFDQFSLNLTLTGISATRPGISAVPLPAAAWLLLSGLTCLGWIGRRRSN
jgi:hypothetical protein